MLYIFKCKWKRGIMHLLTKISTFVNILNCSSREQKQQPLEAETLNFRVLMDCSNQQNLKKLKEILLNVYKRSILATIDKILLLRRVFSKVLVILAWFLLFVLLLFLLIVYISLAFHFEVFQSELCRISVV